ncbi:MAG: hypothetical protein ACP5E3_02495 [Bacteroidales bacterium]
MFTLNLSSDPLTAIEKTLFHDHLMELGLDDYIWVIYEKFLHSGSKYSKPLIIRLSKNDKLIACLFLIKCRDYGSSLSKLQTVKYMVRLFSIPVYIWMKAGIAAEICANPIFLNNKAVSDHNVGEILNHLRKKFLMLFIHDLVANASLHPTSAVITYPDEIIIDITGYNTLDDYLAVHRNLKKKLNKYKNIGGRVEIAKGKLDEHLAKKIKECVTSSGEKSVFKLPYQNDYPDMCKGSATIDNPNIIHFICRSDNEFYGYHSFIEFKDQIRCLNGAFNRNLSTTYHAYENMIYAVVAYAIEKKIQTVFFGPTLNETKKRMMNRFLPTQLYVSSSIPLFLKLLMPLLRRSRLNARELSEFKAISVKAE